MIELSKSKINGILVLSILFITPLIFDDGLFLKYELPKLLFFRTTTGLLFIYFLLSDKSFLVTLLADIKKYLIQLILVCCILFILWLHSLNGILFLWGSYYKNFGLITIVHFLMFGYIVYYCFRLSFVKKYFLYFAFISTFLVFLIALIQLSFTDILRASNGRWVSSFGQPNFLASFVLFLLPYYVLFPIKNKKTIYLKSFIIFISILLIYLSQSRIALLLGLLFLVIYIIKKSTKSYRSLISFFLLVFSILIIFNSRIIEVGLSEELRFDIWQAAIQVIADNFLFGVGFDNILNVLPEKLYSIGINNNGNPVLVDRTHNEFLDWLIYLGLPFGLYVVWAFFSQINKFISLKTNDWFLIASKLSIIFWVISAFVNTNSVWNYLWLAFLMGVQFGESSSSFVVSNLVESNYKLLILKTVLVGCTLWIVGYNFAQYIADYNFKLYLKSGDPAYIEKAVKYNPIEEIYLDYQEKEAK